MPLRFPMGQVWGKIARPIINKRLLCVEVPIGGVSPYGPVEYVIFHDETSDKVRYWSVDTSDGSHVELAAIDVLNEQHESVATDGTYVFIDGATLGNVAMFAWNGTNLVMLHEEETASTGLEPYGMARLTNHDNYFLTIGQLAGDQGMRIVEYELTAPFGFTGTSKTATSDGWAEIMDFRKANTGQWEYGDAAVIAPWDANNMTSYTFSGAVATQQDQLTSDTPGHSHGFGWDCAGGYIVCDYAVGVPSLTIGVWSVNLSDMSLTFIGYGELENAVSGYVGAWAVGLTLGGDYVVTLEETGGLQDVIRTYARNGAGAAPGYPGAPDPSTLVDEYAITDTVGDGVADERAAYFRVNPYTGTIYLLTANTANGLIAFTVDGSGNIDVKAEIAGPYSNNRWGSPMVFSAEALPDVSGTVIPANAVVNDQGDFVFDDQGNFVVLG